MTASRRRGRKLWLAIVGVTCSISLAAPGAAAAAPAQASDPVPAAPRIAFRDATAGSGLDFMHFNGRSGRRYLVETMGSGVCLFDYDNDGHADAYLVQGAATPGSPVPDPAPGNRLLRNDGSAHFADVTAKAGVGDTGQGMGCTAGDIDADGDLDLYIVNFGPNRLYRNDGDGTFTDITEAAGVGDARWGSSASFSDLNGDGHLDLYVVNYVDFRYDNHKQCTVPGRELHYYCSPKAYNAVPDVLYINDGKGGFRDATRQTGVYNDRDGKGLGIVCGDVDADGDTDVYIANDSTRNFLFRNEGEAGFRDVTMLAGVGYSESGIAQAGMGVAFGDYDNDLDLDLIVTNLSNETNELYRNVGRGIFTDPTFSSGVGSPGLLSVGFGVVWVDVDADADLDLFIANGHILDNVRQLSDAMTYAQRNHLFENLGGGRFREISGQAGDGLRLVEVSRGAASADLDGDGDLDVVVTNNGQRAILLLNESARSGHWLQIRLRGRTPNRFAVGARVEISAGGRQQMREVCTGGSYQSQSDLTLHFGLGDSQRLDSVRVRWPGGMTEEFQPGAVDRLVVLEQGSGTMHTASR